MRVSAGFWVTGLSGKMRIQTLPPRRTWRVMAIRAASICLAVIHPGSRAWMPNSPKVTVVPPLAVPDKRPRCCLRCLTFRGMSISIALLAEVGRLVVLLAGAGLGLPFLGQGALQLGIDLGHDGLGLTLLSPFRSFGFGHGRRGLAGLAQLGAAPAPAGGDDTARPALPRGPPRRHVRLAAHLVVGGDLVGEDVALVDPDLDPDPAEGGAGLPEAVVDVGAQGVQRHPAFPVGLPAGHLGAAQPARALHPDALSAGLLHRLQSALHGPADADPARQLVGDALGDQGGIELRLADLLDVALDLGVARDLGPLRRQRVPPGAAAADDDAGPGRVHVDA